MRDFPPIRRLVALCALLAAAAAARAEVVDLGGDTATLHTTNVLRSGVVLANGTFFATNNQLNATFPTGTVTVARGARLVFPEQSNLNVLRADAAGESRLLVDGGVFEVFSHRDYDNYSHYWGYGGAAGVAPVLEVARGGLFHLGLPGGAASSGAVSNRYHFTLGYAGSHVPAPVLRGVDAPDGGFRFDGRVFIGLSAYGYVFCTNCAFAAENIVIGSLGTLNGRTGGAAYLVFAGGSTVTTKGFVHGDNGAEGTVVFDGAIVHVRPSAPEDAVNAQTNFFGAKAGGETSYWIDSAGLLFDNDGHDVTIAAPLRGAGALYLAGAGATRLACAQPFTGGVFLGADVKFRPARDLVFAGAVHVADEAALERPEPPRGHNHVRLFSASAIYGITGRKDAAGRFFFTCPGRDGVELHWGRLPGTEVKLR